MKLTQFAATMSALMIAGGAAMAENHAQAEVSVEADAEVSAMGATAETDSSAMAMAESDNMSENPMVGGAAMFANKTIVDNAVNSADHTTLVAAVQAADLVETLQGPGPFTVFAPVNDAFAALPEGTVETLLMPENKAMLQKVLTAHVVSGTWTAADIVAKANASADGFFHFNAVSGDALSAQVKGGNVFIFDESGNAARVTIADVMQSNGVIHVVNAVLVPK